MITATVMGVLGYALMALCWRMFGPAAAKASGDAAATEDFQPPELLEETDVQPPGSQEEVRDSRS